MIGTGVTNRPQATVTVPGPWTTVQITPDQTVAPEML